MDESVTRLEWAQQGACVCEFHLAFISARALVTPIQSNKIIKMQAVAPRVTVPRVAAKARSMQVRSTNRTLGSTLGAL